MPPCYGIESRVARRLFGIAFAVALSSVAGSAPAQPATNEITAQALFDEGLTLMDQGRYSEACPKLAESQRLDPGGGTLLNLARCHEQEGKLATAWSEFKNAMAMARTDGRQDRLAFAQEHADALEPRLGRLSILVPAGSRVAGLEVTLDGSPITTTTWGMALPVDQGAHAVHAKARGFVPWDGKVSVTTEASKSTITVPRLAPSAEPSPEPAGAEPAPDESTNGSAQQTAGYVIGAAGIASTIVGGIFGGLAIARSNESDDLCNDSTCPPTSDGQEAVNLNEEARTDALLSNVFVGVGLGLVAVGLVVVLTAPSGEQEGSTGAMVAPIVGRDGGALFARFLW